jgi:hypothetical protein
LKFKFDDLALRLAGRDLALLAALRHVAARTNADADAAYHESRLAIEGLKHRILRESKIHKRLDYHRNLPNETEEERTAQCARETEEEREERRANGKLEQERVAEEKRVAEENLLATRSWHLLARLVRMKSYELGKGKPRRSKGALNRSLEELPTDRHLGPDDLSPVENRAIEIIRGAKRNAKKNPIEKNAIAIADAVLADISPVKESGRPASRPNIIFDVESFQHNLKLTVIEVVEVVLLIIERLAGPNNSTAPGSMMIAAVVAAVESAGLACDPGLAAEYVGRLRRRRSAATP